MTDQAAPTIGWLGTGRMGFELAVRLLNSGTSLKVWNRTREKAEPLAGLGATVVDRPADLADCDIVFSIVSSSDVFVDVTLGEGGLLTVDGSVPGLLVDSSTISADASERVRQAADKVGCKLLAAPVSGSPKVIKSGRLGVVASGPREAFDTARPYLERFGNTVTYVGEGDHARLVKICHNLILGVVTQVLSETTVLAEKAGIARADYLEFINGSVMGSVFTNYKTPGLVNLDFSPTFTGHLLRKDFELGLDAARELDVALPVSAQVHQMVVDMIGNGLGDEDFSHLLTMAARGAGLELTSEDRDDVSDGLTPPIDDLSQRRPE
ncbi:NAD(P)-dependent oxidoreductase [Egicoccus sp. AB-alg6-2]|uniref:NAD(P)-dependent oxidoreductase n=1 Tax=Egicoccus sp. AB-alg6-2 TaxID=3242692 RepID=UPI00359D4431